MSYQASVRWIEGKHFEGSAAGHTITIDAPVPIGTDQGMNPMMLMLVALGGCTGMDVVNILTKERKQITRFTVDVSAERAAEIPTVYTDIQLTFKIAGPQLTRELIEHAVQLSEEKYCSVGIMMGKTAKIRTEIEVSQE